MAVLPLAALHVRAEHHTRLVLAMLLAVLAMSLLVDGRHLVALVVTVVSMNLILHRVVVTTVLKGNMVRLMGHHLKVQDAVIVVLASSLIVKQSRSALPALQEGMRKRKKVRNVIIVKQESFLLPSEQILLPLAQIVL